MWFSSDVQGCPRCGHAPFRRISGGEGRMFRAENMRLTDDGNIAYDDVDVGTGTAE